jgi:release factor glutamine methyltransferase
MTLEHIVQHRSPGGRVIYFENHEGHYPINRYQSLLLATCASTEALALAAESGRKLHDLRVMEPCCGGGPAAITLKVMGAGYVGASDIDEAAVTRCSHNAGINGVALDCVDRRDLLGPASATSYDLIACNPPCGWDHQADQLCTPSLQRAVRAGPAGVEQTLRLIADAPAHLRPGGRLLVVVTSTVDFQTVIETLDRTFPSAWYMAQGTPVAAPFLARRDPNERLFLAARDRGKAFVWHGPGGNLWRLSWVLVACCKPTSADIHPGLSFRPFGREVDEADYFSTLDSFSACERDMKSSSVSYPHLP